MFGMLSVRSGRIFFDGEEITNRMLRALIARGICYVPQGRNIFPELSVAPTISSLAASPRPKDFDPKPRMEAAMDRFPVLRRKAHQQASTLSGGEQKMLEIARGLLLQPEVDADRRTVDRIVADPGVQELFALIKDMRGRGTTVLLIEQNAKRALEN